MAGSVRLIIEQGSQAGRVIPLQEGGIVAGRGQGSDLRLSEAGISRQHARFQAAPQGWAVLDLGSTNGTFVNGQRLPPHQPFLLRPGDRIAIGTTLLVVLPDADRTAVPDQELQEEQPGGKRRPALLVMGAVGLVVVLLGIVVLIVALLQPEAGPVTPTVAGPLDQMATAFPVPTGFQDVMTSVATMLPTGFPRLPLGKTPTPEAALPGRETTHGPRSSAALGPIPEPPMQPGRPDAAH